MNQPTHFKGKEAIEHVAEAQAQGILNAAEIHGTEIPGHLSAAADAAREIAVFLALVWILISRVALHRDLSLLLSVLGIFSLGSILWKTARSSWMGWFRLERLHRVLEQERWEIEHHRQQERDELRVLYQAKGFEGKLLEDVLDVLMADNDRLLHVMVEEELGLSLQTTEHPLKQGIWAGLGALLAAIVCLLGLWIQPHYGLLLGSLITAGLSAGISAYLAQNRIISAVIWNLGFAILAFGTVFFMLEYKNL